MNKKDQLKMIADAINEVCASEEELCCASLDTKGNLGEVLNKTYIDDFIWNASIEESNISKVLKKTYIDNFNWRCTFVQDDDSIKD